MIKRIFLHEIKSLIERAISIPLRFAQAHADFEFPGHLRGDTVFSNFEVSRNSPKPIDEFLPKTRCIKVGVSPILKANKLMMLVVLQKVRRRRRSVNLKAWSKP
jgi:hypothetical protein